MLDMFAIMVSQEKLVLRVANVVGLPRRSKFTHFDLHGIKYFDFIRDL